VKRIMHWLVQKAWTEPAAIKGVTWTICFWVLVVLGFSATATLFSVGKGIYVPIMGVALVLMKIQKPKKLGRPLPYRRRR